MKRAFTLIELLVVIAIIAILAAILFPVFAQAKAAAKKTASVSNIKQQATGILLYSNDTEDVFPLATVQDDTPNPLAYDVTWVKTNQPYVKSLDLFVSPGGKIDLSSSDKTPSNRPVDSGPLGARGGPRAQGGPIVSYGLVPRAYWTGVDTSAACTPAGASCLYQNEYDGKTAFYDGVAGAAASDTSNDRCYASNKSGYPAPSLSTTSVSRPSDQILLQESSFWDNGGCYGFVAYPRARFNYSKISGFFKDGVAKGNLVTAYTDSHAAAIPAERLYEILGDATSGYYYKRMSPSRG